jgi:hypothetical protein
MTEPYNTSVSTYLNHQSTFDGNHKVILSRRDYTEDTKTDIINVREKTPTKFQSHPKVPSIVNVFFNPPEKYVKGRAASTNLNENAVISNSSKIVQRIADEQRKRKHDFSPK